MTDSRGRAWAWSISLVVGGVILLLFNFGWLDAYAPWPQFLLAGGCGVAAAIFFVGFAGTHQEWWRLLPAWTLAALATMALTSTLEGADRALIVAQVFAGLALAFGHIYLPARAERWWAILPGGFMLVLAIVVGASSWVSATEILAALLFIGLGLVFFLLYLLDQKRRQWWALIPGSVLLVFGVLALSSGRVGDTGEEASLVRWWPLALILVGLLIGLRPRLVPRGGDKLVINSAPRVQAQQSSSGKTSNAKSGAQPVPRASLGEYTQPAPGASVEVLTDND
jgi:MFS family permease